MYETIHSFSSLGHASFLNFTFSYSFVSGLNAAIFLSEPPTAHLCLPDLLPFPFSTLAPMLSAHSTCFLLFTAFFPPFGAPTTSAVVTCHGLATIGSE